MTREEIRDLIRVLGDELTEANQGLFTDDSLNTLINQAQTSLLLKLIPVIPKEFRGTAVTFDYLAGYGKYNIVTDIGIAADEFFMFESIQHTKTGQRPTPLYYLDRPDDVWQYGNFGVTGSDPKAWGYSDRENIFILPTASATVTSRLGAYWWKRLTDLNHDTSDAGSDVATPTFDVTLHALIAYEVLKVWAIRDRDSELRGWINSRMDEILWDAGYAMSMKQGFTTGRLPGAKEYLSFDSVSSNLTP